MPFKKGQKRIRKVDLDKSTIPKEGIKESEFIEESKPKDEAELKAEKDVIAELLKLKEQFLKDVKDKDKSKTDLTDEERIKILIYSLKQKVKDNAILQAKIENDRQEYKAKRKLKPTKEEKDKTAIDKAKQQIRKVIKGYIEYFEDPKAKVYNWIEMTNTPPIITNPRRRELFLMDHPCKFLNGKPVYILIKGIPFCIPMEFYIDNLYKEMENSLKLWQGAGDPPVFGRSYLSSMDVYAIFTSIKTIMLFGIKRSIIYTIAMLVFFFLLGMMTLYIIISPYLFTK